MKNIKYIVIILSCLLFSFLACNICYHLIVVRGRTKLLSEYEKTNPQHKTVCFQNIVREREKKKEKASNSSAKLYFDGKEVTSDVIDKILSESKKQSSSSLFDTMFGSSSKEYYYKGSNMNNEHVYELNKEIWKVSYAERGADGVFKSGRIFPLQIISLNKLNSQTDVERILDEAFDIIAKRYDEYEKKDFGDYFTYKQTESDIIQTSNYSQTSLYRGYSNKVLGPLFVSTLTGPYSSEYIIIGNSKVLVLKEVNNYVLDLKPYVKRKTQRYFYLGGAVLFIILSIVTSLKYKNKYLSKTHLLISIIMVSVCYFFVAGLFFHFKHEQNKTLNKELAQEYETDIRFKYPSLECAIKITEYFKGVELDFIKDNFDAYSPVESVRDAYNAVYKYYTDLFDLEQYCESEAGRFLTMPKPTYCDFDRDKERSWNLYQWLYTDLHYLVKSDILKVKSKEDLKEYEDNYNKYCRDLSTEMSEFIKLNKSILGR